MKIVYYSFEGTHFIQKPSVFSICNTEYIYNFLDEQFPDLMDSMAPICKELAQTGTPKQAKGAIHCIFKNMPYENIFPGILECIKNNLTPESPHYRTAIVTLGHIAFNVPERYKVQIKNIVSRKVSKNNDLYISVEIKYKYLCCFRS